MSGAVPALQSVSPALHLYEHVDPLQLAGPVFVLHFAPHPPQLVVDESDDSHPLVSPPLVSQLTKPGWHPPYMQFVPEHVAPMLFTVSHARPQSPQFAGVVICVSQPLVSGGVALQSLYPVSHFVYAQNGCPGDVMVSQLAMSLWAVSHEVPHA